MKKTDAEHPNEAFAVNENRPAASDGPRRSPQLGTILGVFLFLFLFSGKPLPAAPPPTLQSGNYTARTVVSEPWGQKARHFGLLANRGEERVGPRTYAVDEKGFIYVFDTVRSHVKRFDAEGRFLGTVGKDLPGYCLTVRKGSIFLLDGKSVFVYSTEGQLKAELSIAPAIRLFEGYGQWMRMDERGRLFVKAREKSFQVAKTVDGRVVQLSPEEQVSSGRTGFPDSAGGGWFKIDLVDRRKAVLKVISEGGTIQKEVVMQTPDAFGAMLFLDEDASGNIYVLTQTISSDNLIRIAIRVYGTDGVLKTLLIPDDDYYTTVYKKFEVDRHGDIYQIRTTPEGTRVLKWELR